MARIRKIGRFEVTERERRCGEGEQDKTRVGLVNGREK